MDFNIIGQVFNTYIIVQKENEMFIIDQHAAHERIYFEQLLEQYRSSGITSQILMLPITVDFTDSDFGTAAENPLHTMACKRAVKGGDLLTNAEMERLTEKVMSFESINTCPHGRPICIRMSKYELEKNFKRIV